MVESVKSAILQNVQGVKACAGYQNDSNIYDEYGRPPHCIEMVVDGGSDYEIAQQIWITKTDGIQPYGSTEIIVPGDEGEPITMRFNRPQYVYVWFDITIAMSGLEPVPPNAVDAIQRIVDEEMKKITPGHSIVPQRMIDGKIYAEIPGIGFIRTTTFSTVDEAETPENYSAGIVRISPRQRAVTDVSRIGVSIDVT